MYPITNDVKALFEAEQRKVLRITGTDKNGRSISITDDNVIADSFQVDRYSCNGEKLEIGTAIAAQLTLTLENGNGQYDSIAFEGAELFVEVGIADWTQSSPTIHWVPCGYFTPDEQPRRMSTIGIIALDRMMRFDAVPLTLIPWTTANGDVMKTASGETIYFIKSIRFPATIAQIVSQIAAPCEVPFTQDLSGFANYNATVTELPVTLESVTYRTIIQWCAGIMGCNAWIDWTGSLRFSWYTNATGYVSTIDNRDSSDMYENDLTITGVSYTNISGVEFVEGTDEYTIDIIGNSLIGQQVASMLPNIATALNGFTYRPFTATAVNAPYLWPMDIITFTDKDGNEHTSALTNVAFGLNGMTVLESKGITYVVNRGVKPNGFTKEQAQLVNEVKQSVTNLDNSLDQQEIFNRLTDGGAAQGIILYNGQLFVNATYISTGTLVADLVKAGVLGDRAGKNYWNMQTGEFSLSASATVGGSTVKDIADDEAEQAVDNLDRSLTQQEVFDRLTDNDTAQGLILYNGKLYLNAEYIQTGTLVANLLLASILTIGGSSNGNGSLQILDSNGSVIGTWDKNGISVKKGSITGGTINGATLTLGGSNNISGTLTVKDGSGNTVATIDNAGVSVNKGSIAGPTVSLGGANNQSGVLRIYDILGNQFGIFNNAGLALTTSPVGRPTIKVTKQTNLGDEIVTIGGDGAPLDILVERSGASSYFYYRHFTFGSGGMHMENDNNEYATFDIDRLVMGSGTGLSSPSIDLIDTSGNVEIRLSPDSGLVFYVSQSGKTSIDEENAYFPGYISVGNAAQTRANLGITPANIGAVSLDNSDTKNGSLTINGDFAVNANNSINLSSDYTITIGDDYSKIEKKTDGTIKLQSSGGASVTLTNSGNAIMQSDDGEASITLNSNGDIEVTGVVKDKRILQAASAVSIPSVGNTVTVNITGLTDGHQLVRWNFSDSPENIPPADLEWETWDGYFTVTNNGGTTSESITPLFILPE